MSKKEDLNLIQQQLLALKNSADQQLLSEQREDISVKINPDKSVSPGMFKPHPILIGTYSAHPVTIAAMKKDIFVAGEEMFADLENIIVCEGCKRELDTQFWHFCPYCERKFS
jgi:hypothetical protein